MKCTHCSRIFNRYTLTSEIKNHLVKDHLIHWSNKQLIAFLYAISRKKVYRTFICGRHEIEFTNNWDFRRHRLIHHALEGLEMYGGRGQVGVARNIGTKDGYVDSVDVPFNANLGDTKQNFLKKVEDVFGEHLDSVLEGKPMSTNVTFHINIIVKYYKENSGGGIEMGLPMKRFSPTISVGPLIYRHMLSKNIQHLEDNLSLTNMSGSGWKLHSFIMATLRISDTFLLRRANLTNITFGGTGHDVIRDENEHDGDGGYSLIIDEAYHSGGDDDEEVTEVTQADIDMIDDSVVDDDVSFYREVDNIAANVEITEEAINNYDDVEDAPVEDDIFTNKENIPEERDEVVEEEEVEFFPNDKTEKEFKSDCISPNVTDGTCVFTSMLLGISHKIGEEMLRTEEEFKNKHAEIYADLLKYRDSLIYVSQRNLAVQIYDINESVGAKYGFYINVYRAMDYGYSVNYFETRTKRITKIFNKLTRIYIYSTRGLIGKRKGVFLVYKEFKDFRIQGMMYLKSLQQTAKVETSGKFRVLKMCEVCCDGFTTLATYNKHVEQCINGETYNFVHNTVRTYEDHIGKVREHHVVFFYDLETYQHVREKDFELIPVSYSWCCNVRNEIGLPTFVSYKAISSPKKDIGDFSYIPDLYFDKIPKHVAVHETKDTSGGSN